MYFSNQIYINFKHADFNVGFFFSLPLSITVVPANISSHCTVDDAFKPTAIETIVLVKKGIN